MPTIMEQAAQTIATLGTEAGGCDCTYTPVGPPAGTPVALKAVVNARTIENAGPGRGQILGAATTRRQLVTFLIQRTQDGILKADTIREGDFLDVPGYKVGRPGSATVKLKVVAPRLIENSHWTGELA